MSSVVPSVELMKQGSLYRKMFDFVARLVLLAFLFPFPLLRVVMAALSD
jgi:lipopolysaccharide/colanic/teichoic acid biosynthesis glycosyltransferase